jgi:hypothetical protein
MSLFFHNWYNFKIYPMSFMIRTGSRQRWTNTWHFYYLCSNSWHTIRNELWCERLRLQFCLLVIFILRVQLKLTIFRYYNHQITHSTNLKWIRVYSNTVSNNRTHKSGVYFGAHFVIFFEQVHCMIKNWRKDVEQH